MTIAHIVPDTTTGADAADIVNALVDAAELTATADLTANQLNHLTTSPVQMVAAPGAGKILFPTKALLIYHVGSRLYYTQQNLDHPQIAIGSSYLANADNGILNIDSLADSATLISFSTMLDYLAQPLSLAATENQALFFGNPLGDLIDYGEVTASTILDGGAGYANGDTGGFNQNNTTGTYTVTSVDGGGAVTGYTLDVVNGAQVGQTLTTYVITGGGDGNFSISADTIAPGDGTASLVLKYQVFDIS